MRKKVIKKETEVIYDYIVRRIKRGLGLNALITGPPGIGKSYVCLRIAEKVYMKLHNEKLDVRKNVVYDLPSAFRFVREVDRPGEVLVIEEVSVMASSRRSMALENVSLNYLLDTVRKKQIILLLNGPHIKAIDKHIQRMSHLLIELLRINKKEKLSTAKAFTLTNSQDTGKVYKHRFRMGSKQVHRSFFTVPSKYVIKDYEEMKNEFMEGLYQKMEEKNLAKMGYKKKDAKKVLASEHISDMMLARYIKFKQLNGDYHALAKAEGIDISSARKSIKKFEEKADIQIVKNEKIPIQVSLPA